MEPTFVPVTTCGGNTSDTPCQCPPGWTGRGDAPTAGLTPWGGELLACRFHEAALAGLWATSLGLTIAVTFYTYVLRCACSRRLRTFRLKRAKVQQQQLGSNTRRRYRWWEHRQLLSDVVIFPAVLLAHIILCVMKLTMPQDALIMVHFVPTILMITSCVGVNLVGYFDLGRNMRKIGTKFEAMVEAQDRAAAAKVAQQQAKWAQRWQLAVVVSFMLWIIPCFFEPRSPWPSNDDGTSLSTYGLALVLSSTPQPVFMFVGAINYRRIRSKFDKVIRRVLQITHSLSFKKGESSRQIDQAAGPEPSRKLARRDTVKMTTAKIIAERKRMNSKLVASSLSLTAAGIFTLFLPCPGLWLFASYGWSLGLGLTFQVPCYLVGRTIRRPKPAVQPKSDLPDATAVVPTMAIPGS